MYLLYFKRLTIINILTRIKTDWCFFFFLLCILLLKVTWHTQNLCSAFNPSKVHTHTAVNTHIHTHREHTPGAVGSHLYCILMLVIMVVLGKPNIFWGGTWCKKFENHWFRCFNCRNKARNLLEFDYKHLFRSKWVEMFFSERKRETFCTTIESSRTNWADVSMWLLLRTRVPLIPLSRETLWANCIMKLFWQH